MDLRPDTNIARMRRFRYATSGLGRHFEVSLCQLNELQRRGSPGCLVNLKEGDGAECSSLSVRSPVRVGFSICAWGCGAHSCGSCSGETASSDATC